MSSSRTTSVVLSTTLSPIAHGVLGALAAREDPAHGAANIVLTRLLREEVERLAPGAWDTFVYRQSRTDPDVSPREASECIAGDLAAILCGKGDG